LNRLFSGVALLALFVLIVTAPRLARATSLTGAVLFDTDSPGAAIGNDWNTLGGDAAFNLYLTNPSFLNSGNGAQTRIDVALIPGTNYTFGYLATSGPSSVSQLNQGFFGLNLFFNGNDSTPEISVHAPLFSSSFAPDSAVNTPRLDTSPTPGSGVLVFSDGATSVTLTSFSAVASLSDLVGPYATAGDSTPDYAGSFTLAVTATPEPATLSLLLLAAAIVSIGSFVRLKIRVR
jgi:hypothetical protein